MKHLPFDSLYRHGFARVAVAVPRVRVADPGLNVEHTLAPGPRGRAAGAALAVFPELGLSAYTDEDLFHQDALLDAVDDALAAVVARERRDRLGAARRRAAAVRGEAVQLRGGGHRGEVLGVVPKSYLPNYREFYEKRQFTAAREALVERDHRSGQQVPFGTDLLFDATNLPGFALHVEICEDVWVPDPAQHFGALAGATVLANLSASNITIGKAEYRRAAVRGAVGALHRRLSLLGRRAGESTTDLAWDGQALIYENGDLLAESERFADRRSSSISPTWTCERLAAGPDAARPASPTTSHDHRERLARLCAGSRSSSGSRASAIAACAARRALPVRAQPTRARRDERCCEVHRHPGRGPGEPARAPPGSRRW